ncbi:MAG: M28 family peptidase [Candidatus Hydrogenedentes bacterium]|nr:M28 family peptidase [Candidatus Hydrogenedentota bacterium]
MMRVGGVRCLVILLSTAALAGPAALKREVTRVDQVADSVSQHIDEDELRGHVGFLAQPALKGRRILSAGSDIAHQYVVERFTAYGLVPWGSEESHEQPFTLGTNLIGVLPGSDSVLRDEFVVLCAHIDHVGDGHLGACDNASGVAALLETAEFFSQSKERPARSICFAVVDAEELGLIGSFVFTRREDYDPRRIAGVVNVDMLGRSFLDIMDQSIIVAGAERYPRLRDTIDLAARGEDLKVLPLATTFLPSDYIMFVAADTHNPNPPPILMFTCGYFGDYHTRKDTAGRLDYATLARSARLIEETVGTLAAAPTVEQPVQLAGPDRTELITMKAVGDETLRRKEELKFTKEEYAACEEWLNSVESLIAASDYSQEDRRQLLHRLDALGPVLDRLLGKTIMKAFPRDAGNPLERTVAAMELMEVYAPALYTLYGRFVEDVLKEDPRRLYLHGMKDMESYHMLFAAPGDIRLTSLGGDHYRLDTLIPSVYIIPQVRRFGRVSLGFSMGASPNLCEGSRDELIDHCLLEWCRHVPDEAYDRLVRSVKLPRFMSDDGVEYMLAQHNDPLNVAAWDRVCVQMLETVAGESHGMNSNDWLTWRLESTGALDTEAWMLGLLDTRNEYLFSMAAECLTRVPSEDIREKLCRRMVDIVADASRPARIRKRAAFAAAVRGDKETLIELAQYVDDQTPVDTRPERTEVFQEHPLFLHGKRNSPYSREEIERFPKQMPLGTHVGGCIVMCLQKGVARDRDAVIKAVEDSDKTLPSNGPWLLPSLDAGPSILELGDYYLFWSLYGEG